MNKAAFSTIDEYIALQPKEMQPLLKQVRKTIKKTVPQAVEVISYNMPAFKQNGVLVYFAACKQHIGFYPTSSGVTAFQHKLKACKTSKGAIQFPIDKPLPLDLISEITLYRLQQNLQKIKPSKK